MRLYVLVRRDLPLKAQAVQAGHAALQLLQEGLNGHWDGTLIYLGVSSENKLHLWSDKLTRKGISWTGFREPDMDNELTAIATLSDGKALSQLSLL
jgi:hypothetical protein